MSDMSVDAGCFLDALPVGILVLGAGGEVQAHNDLALEMLGIDVEALLGATASEALGDATLRDAIGQVLEKGASKAHVSYQRDGQSFAVTVSRADGGACGERTVIAVTDTTHFKQMERVKEQFVETVLHKLRGPLATVKTSLSVLDSGRIPGMPDEAREIVDMSYHEVNRLNALLNDLRSLFLIDIGLAGKDMDVEVFALGDAVSAALRDLGRLPGPGERAAERVSLEGDPSLRVRADFSMIKQALFHVLRNALAYSNEPDPVRVTVTEESGMVAARVRDAGEGIAPNDLPHIFSRFYRGDTPVTRNIEGNGLGLFLAKSFIEIMGGTIYCESLPGKGAVFCLRLPAGDEEPEAK